MTLDCSPSLECSLMGRIPDGKIVFQINCTHAIVLWWPLAFTTMILYSIATYVRVMEKINFGTILFAQTMDAL
jgi:hypothetical protein